MLANNLASNFSSTSPSSFQGDHSDLSDPNKLTVTYIGHATVLINFFGTTILTDPVYSHRLGVILKRKVYPGLKLEDLPRLDFVVASHPHLDHFDRPTLRRLAHKTANLVIPKNTSDLITNLGFSRFTELHWEDELDLNGLKIQAIKPQHWGARLPWESIPRGYNSYLLRKNGINILFAGDTGYTENFKKIANQFPIDIALLPITAYNPPAFRPMHMNPEDAIRVFLETKAKYLIPIHWGTFRLSLEPMDEPPRLITDLMTKNGMQQNLALLKPGEMFEFR